MWDTDYSLPYWYDAPLGKASSSYTIARAQLATVVGTVRVARGVLMILSQWYHSYPSKLPHHHKQAIKCLWAHELTMRTSFM